MTKSLAREQLYGQTARNMKEIFIGTNSREKVNIGVKMEITIQANGKMANKTDKEQKPGPMVLSM
jgi:hypothetical protein